nr:hypothetical protein GCM10020092_041820 [Actinoplanes digitatis]
MPSLSGMSAGEFTDHYVKLYFPPPGTTYPEPFDLAVIRETMPRERQPLVRTYTVRRWLPEVPELWIDFVVHGDAGIAGPWAAGARPGDPVRFMGPGGGYAPDPDADWHLLADDESALPAIAVALERMPARRAGQGVHRGRGPGGGAEAGDLRRRRDHLAAPRRPAARRAAGA